LPDEHLPKCAFDAANSTVVDTGVDEAAQAARYRYGQGYRWFAGYRGGGATGLRGRSAAPGYYRHGITSERIVEITSAAATH
jgi:hypothetical protein